MRLGVPGVLVRGWEYGSCLPGTSDEANQVALERTRSKLCRGKRCYKTKVAALDCASRVLRYQSGAQLRAYKCSLCGSWHLTKKSLRR